MVNEDFGVLLFKGSIVWFGKNLQHLSYCGFVEKLLFNFFQRNIDDIDGSISDSSMRAQRESERKSNAFDPKVFYLNELTSFKQWDDKVEAECNDDIIIASQ